MGVSINFEGNVDQELTNENASTNYPSMRMLQQIIQSVRTMEHHEEETSKTTVIPNNEKKVTGSSIHSIIFLNISNIHYNLTISYVQ